MAQRNEAKPGVAAEEGKLDVGLYLKRLEERILHGDNIEHTRMLLQKESVWRRLDTEERLWWAQLAQMAEDPGTARRILSILNRDAPKSLAAWHQHLELLFMTGSREAFAGLLARARPYIGEKGHCRWIQRLPGNGSPDEEDLQAAAGPFDRHHQRMAALQHFLDLFSGRRDCFARQWVDKKGGKQGYVPERRPMGPSDLEEHLSGRKTYGVYFPTTER